MKEHKFKVGDKVNCTVEREGFSEWKNATIIKVEEGAFPYRCTCEYYGEEEGLFAEDELELA